MPAGLGGGDQNWRAAGSALSRNGFMRLTGTACGGARQKRRRERLKSYNLADFGRLSQCTNPARPARQRPPRRPHASRQAARPVRGRIAAPRGLCSGPFRHRGRPI
ncbi:hypothetical protein FFM54_30195 [Burkholderia pseudomallei]|nr:hypothetical protein FFM54_30195 [Burkholderia pseudomallei]